jgi:hypothetical protein
MLRFVTAALAVFSRSGKPKEPPKQQLRKMEWSALERYALNADPAKHAPVLELAAYWLGQEDNSLAHDGVDGNAEIAYKIARKILLHPDLSGDGRKAAMLETLTGCLMESNHAGLHRRIIATVAECIRSTGDKLLRNMAIEKMEALGQKLDAAEKADELPAVQADMLKQMATSLAGRMTGKTKAADILAHLHSLKARPASGHGGPMATGIAAATPL